MFCITNAAGYITTIDWRAWCNKSASKPAGTFSRHITPHEHDSRPVRAASTAFLGFPLRSKMSPEARAESLCLDFDFSPNLLSEAISGAPPQAHPKVEWDSARDAVISLTEIDVRNVEEQSSVSCVSSGQNPRGQQNLTEHTHCGTLCTAAALRWNPGASSSTTQATDSRNDWAARCDCTVRPL